MRRHAPSLVLPCAAVTLALFLGCDRNNLSEGPRLSSDRNTTGKPVPDPPNPGSGDCLPPPVVSGLKVKINEIMPQNTSMLEDEKGQFVPWIEIYNNSDAEVNLGGISLSNDLLDPNKWKIPCIPEARVAPRGFLIIFADGDSTNEKDLHANFILAAQGSVQLIINKGSDLFVFDASKLETDESAGRYKDGAPGVSKLVEPTPGTPNMEPAKLSAPNESSFLRGDANSDGRVNITDMTLILRVLFQAAVGPSCVDRMDANDDGAVNLSDALHLGQALYQNGPTIPAPFPSIGNDPTPDGLSCPSS